MDHSNALSLWETKFSGQLRKTDELHTELNTVQQQLNNTVLEKNATAERFSVRNYSSFVVCVAFEQFSMQGNAFRILPGTTGKAGAIVEIYYPHCSG